MCTMYVTTTDVKSVLKVAAQASLSALRHSYFSNLFCNFDLTGKSAHVQLQGQEVAVERRHQGGLHPAMGPLLHPSRRPGRSCLLRATGWQPSKQLPKNNRYALCQPSPVWNPPPPPRAGDVRDCSALWLHLTKRHLEAVMWRQSVLTVILVSSIMIIFAV